VSCGVPTAPLNGGVQAVDYSVGTRLTYFCNNGFRLSSKDLTTTVCQPDGTWSNHNKTPRCTGRKGEEMSRCWYRTSLSVCFLWTIVNGSSYEFRTKIIFSCNPGYYRLGPAHIQCMANGAWSWRNETTSMHRSSAIFSCIPGYILVGSTVRECMLSGLWSGIEAQCL
ncbi:unnamed protein product, partial [Coregonus sp. 'balchen']